MRPFLDDGKAQRGVHSLPNLRELLGHQFTEDFADTDAGVKISLPSDTRPPAPVIAILWMVERLLHETLQRHRTEVGDLIS